MDDDATDLGGAGFGLMFYNARWYDPALGRFAQADSIIPKQSQGIQAWDRYAYVNNNPVLKNDPSGHCPICVIAWIALNADAITTVAISAFVAVTAASGAYDAYQAGDTNGALQSAAMIPMAAMTGSSGFSELNSIEVSTEELSLKNPQQLKLLPSPKEEFGNEGSIILNEADYHKWGQNWKGNTPEAYVIPKADADALKYAPDISEINRRLGINLNNESSIMRIDIKNLDDYNIRMPNGTGGNSMYQSGGLTSGGIPERAINPLNLWDEFLDKFIYLKK